MLVLKALQALSAPQDTFWREAHAAGTPWGAELAGGLGELCAEATAQPTPATHAILIQLKAGETADLLLYNRQCKKIIDTT